MEKAAAEQQRLLYYSPLAAAVYDGNEILTSVFTAPSGSAHELPSTGVAHSRVTAPTGSVPRGSVLTETAVSVFIAASSDSKNEPSSTIVWVSSTDVSIEAAVAVVWRGAWRVRLLSALLLPADVAIWEDDKERSFLFPPTPRQTVPPSSNKAPLCRAPLLLKSTPGVSSEVEGRTMPS